MRDWGCENAYKKDTQALIYRLDTKTIYKPTDCSRAIWCESDYGPSFGYDYLTLAGYSYNLNYEDGSVCCVNVEGGYDTFYDIKADEQGNSPVTGEGSKQG